MVLDDICNTALSLSSGFINNTPEKDFQSHHQLKKKLLFDGAFPSLTLGLPSEQNNQSTVLLYRQACSLSAVSSLSHFSVKRERNVSAEVVEVETVVPLKATTGDDQDEEGSVRKKLRLTKQQSVMLEDCFKEQSTLNPKQKQALAKQLNLLPRQVEVWFQNRRARTKLKQNEKECELLKKHLETLKNENKRLKKELQEMKSLKVTVPFYVQFPSTTLTVCKSCDRSSPKVE
ncbi:Homeobox-leucine zipper protein [Actinidia chinensis var. chinensis]|uniref:Homeobox-leucine zipper protein n=1 Tax=Actinidia chinensis var. chinensis TaxID=1590841 RepID=A0A2R6Q0L7_ACTCC|nr:Homeobox-leucine zipper protein [Actinidia chinensis var. chinensis]